MNSDGPSLNRRQWLSLAVRSMLIVLVLAFMFVFFRGIGGSTVSAPGADKENSVVASLLLGQTGLRRFAGQRIWITRLSEAQRTEANTVTPYLFSVIGGCAIVKEFCSFSAATGQSGIELSFTELAPAQLPSQIPWFGGFVNPTNGAVYDRLGRAYKLGNQAPVQLELIDLN